jgi:FixJ family two-component response regulator
MDSRLLMQRKVVAVVEDDPMIREAIADLLRSLGVASEVFASAEAFLDTGAAREFDCILLDIHLGGMSGFELHRQLKAACSTFPVIFMTGSADEAMREQALSSGCVAYLRKPFLARPLLEALEIAAPQKA